MKFLSCMQHMCILIVLMAFFAPAPAILYAENGGQELTGLEYQNNYVNIRSTNGKLYAYIVLLIMKIPFCEHNSRAQYPCRFNAKRGVPYRGVPGICARYQGPAPLQAGGNDADSVFTSKKIEDKNAPFASGFTEKRNIILRFSREKSSRRNASFLITVFTVRASHSAYRTRCSM